MTGYTDKEYGKDMGHDGIDIGLPDQTPIFCAHSEAEVIAIDEYPDTYGLFVLLYDKTNGTITRYSHLSNVDPDIQMGSTVTHTSRIGLS